MVILEGEAWHLRARVSGTPTPQITWFKNGVPIEGATEYLIQYDSQNGVCRLSGQVVYVILDSSSGTMIIII